MLYLVVIVLCAVIGTVILVDEVFDVKENIGFGFLGSIIGALGGCVASLLIAGAVTIFAEHEDVKHSEEEISAIGNDTEVSGSFFLGSGSIDGKMKYFYISEASRGSKIENVDAERAYIIEDNSETPKIITYESVPKSSSMRFWLPTLSDNTYDIIIPEDSVKRDFNVSLD